MNSDKPDCAPTLPSADHARGASELFQGIVADGQEGVVVLGPDGMVQYANAAAEFLLGHGRTELVGEMFGLPRVTTDEPTTVNVISRDGCVRLAEFRVEPSSTGLEGSLVLRFKDVTSYLQDVASAREQVRRRDEFLAMLSHEIRNPLAAIRGAGLLLTGDGVQLDIRRAAGEIFDRQFKHLDRILADLLDVARISRGKLSILRERVELNRIIRDAVEEAALLVARKEHRLRVDIPREKVWVDGDATRLQQVVVNLLNNAAKFTPVRGNIAVAMTVVGEEVEIGVRDDGPGIPQDLLPRVFEPFVQGKQSMDRSEGGLGIGLSLVNSFVTLHGGSVCVTPNADGPGLTIAVRLPVAEAGAEPSAEVEIRPAHPLRPLRILLVEDGGDSRRVLKQILELEGHEVLEAEDGPAGLAALLQRRPDVALLDIGLPGLDGYEVARRARQDEGGRQVRLVALTGYGMPEDVREAREAGFDRHLIKPLRYPELRKMLREVQVSRALPESGAGGCPAADGR